MPMLRIRPIVLTVDEADRRLLLRRGNYGLRSCEARMVHLVRHQTLDQQELWAAESADLRTLRGSQRDILRFFAVGRDELHAHPQTITLIHSQRESEVEYAHAAGPGRAAGQSLSLTQRSPAVWQ